MANRSHRRCWISLISILYIIKLVNAQPRQRAVCQLQIRGYGSSNSSDISVASASLSCSSNNGPVAIQVDSTYMTKNINSFKGVQVNQSLPCNKAAESQYVYPLLIFCGSYQLELQNPVIENIRLPQNSDYFTAVLAFGNSMKANIIGGRMTNNAATALLAMQHAQMSVYNTTISNSKGTYGVAVQATGTSKVSISGSSFRNLTGAQQGGAVWAGDDSSVSIMQTSFTANKADYGGAIYLTGNANAQFRQCSFSSNNASHEGGAVYINTARIANVVFESCNFTDNTAANAGGLYADNSSVVNVSSSTFQRNAATTRGGAGGVGQQAQLTLFNCSVHNNSAVQTRETSSGGAFQTWSNSSLLIAGSTVNANRARWGGATSSDASSMVNLSDSTVADNVAEVDGGGVHIYADAQVVLTSGSISSNKAANRGGGIFAGSESTVNLASGQFRVHDNCAGETGGGLFLEEKASVVMTQQSVAATVYLPGTKYTTTLNASAAAVTAVFDQNTAQTGADFSVVPTSLVLLSTPVVNDFVARPGVDDNVLWATLNVTGAMRLPCDGVPVEARLENATIPLAAVVTDTKGIAKLALRMAEPPGSYTVWFRTPTVVNVPDTLMLVHVRGCVKGEVAPRPNTCDVCVSGFYSLNPAAQQCEPCPEHASCSSGALIVPELGFWHSDPDSDQIHRCPNQLACQGDRNLVKVCSTQSTTAEALSECTDLQCSKGYQGNVCGACQAGYGSQKPFSCMRCMSAGTIVSLYAVGALVMLGFIKLLLHFTLAENFATKVVEADAPAPLTELLRCLILYSQRIIIIGSLQMDWPGSVVWPLKAMGWVWATSSPETLSIDCVLPTDASIPVAAQRVLFYLCVPIGMMIVLLLIELILSIDTRLHSQSTSRAKLSDRLGASAMVVAYFFLPAVLRQLFGLFACIPLDQPVEPPRVAKAVGSFWVYDVATQCWKGYHKPLAFGLGLPLIFLLCIGLPAAIVYKTVSNRHNLDDPVFVQYYGDLTCSYRPSKCWWEAVITLETILLTAISVFGVNIGAFYQSIVMSAALAIMVQMQSTFRPYAHAQTGRAMLRGTQVLLITSFIGQTFIPSGTFEVDSDAAHRYGLVMGVCLLVLNLAYVLYVLWLLYKLIEWRRLFGIMGAVTKGLCACNKKELQRARAEFAGVLETVPGSQLRPADTRERLKDASMA